MLLGKRIVAVLPACNAARTLARPYREIPGDLADEIIPVADAGSDDTTALARRLGIRQVLLPDRNRGGLAWSRLVQQITTESGRKQSERYRLLH